MRALSVRQASNCETAKTSVCRCRCKGAFHGMKRSGAKEPDPAFLAALPLEDPHHVDDKGQKRERKRQEKRDKKRRAEEAHWNAGLFGNAPE